MADGESWRTSLSKILPSELNTVADQLSRHALRDDADCGMEEVMELQEKVWTMFKQRSLLKSASAAAHRTEAWEHPDLSYSRSMADSIVDLLTSMPTKNLPRQQTVETH